MRKKINQKRSKSKKVTFISTVIKSGVKKPGGENFT